MSHLTNFLENIFDGASVVCGQGLLFYVRKESQWLTRQANVHLTRIQPGLLCVGTGHSALSAAPDNASYSTSLPTLNTEHPWDILSMVWEQKGFSL